MKPLDAFLLAMAPVFGIGAGIVLGLWSERRRRAREAYLAVCLDLKRAEADQRIDLHYSTLPDFVNGDTK